LAHTTLDDTAFQFIEVDKRRDCHFAPPLMALTGRVIAFRDRAKNCLGLGSRLVNGERVVASDCHEPTWGGSTAAPGAVANHKRLGTADLDSKPEPGQVEIP
jgi:hypothetical protein